MIVNTFAIKKSVRALKQILENIIHIYFEVAALAIFYLVVITLSTNVSNEWTVVNITCHETAVDCYHWF